MTTTRLTRRSAVCGKGQVSRHLGAGETNPGGENEHVPSLKSVYSSRAGSPLTPARRSTATVNRLPGSSATEVRRQSPVGSLLLTATPGQTRYGSWLSSAFPKCPEWRRRTARFRSARKRRLLIRPQAAAWHRAGRCVAAAVAATENRAAASRAPAANRAQQAPSRGRPPASMVCGKTLVVGPRVTHSLGFCDVTLRSIATSAPGRRRGGTVPAKS